MQPIVRWLVARPQNAVLGLAASFLLPLAPILSGVVMVLVTLQHGPSRAAVFAGLSAIVLSAIALATSIEAPTVLANAASIWLPALLLAALLRHWRSITLVLQVTVILAVLVFLVSTAVIGDTVAYGVRLLTDLAAGMSSAGLQQQADILLAAQSELAPQMLFIVVFLAWQASVVTVLIGNALVQAIPEQDAGFGRFRDLNFGKVLATVTVFVSLAGWIGNAVWLQHIALLMFMAFWMQGLALVHWLKDRKRLPGVVLILLYVSLPILHALPLTALALTGFADAWLNYRRRATS